MVKLSQMRLVNCQSWKDGVLEFTNGLNVIRADNNTGKSVIFKCLRATANPSGLDRDDRKDFIRRKCEYAEITYLFSDNSAGVVRIFLDKTIYFFSHDVTKQQFHSQQDEPHESLINRLSFILDRENGYVANILDDEQPLLLVKSSNKANYNLVKILTEHPQLSRLIEIFKLKFPEYRGELSHIRGAKNRLEYKLNNSRYVDEESLSYSINTGEEFLEVFDILINILKLTYEINSNIVSDAPWNELYEVSNAFTKLNETVKDIDLDITSIDNDLIELGNFLPNLNLDLKPELPKDIVDSFTLIDTLVETASEIKEWGKDISLDELEQMELVSNVVTTSCNLFNSLTKQEKILSQIEELEKIDFEGEEYDCPLHGRIKYTNGGCQPL